MRIYIQLIIAVVAILSGLIMLFMGLWIKPYGVIDSSVLVAFGEVATFAGSVLGIDYTYKFKKEKLRNEDK